MTTTPDADFSPNQHEDSITLVLQKDGTWEGHRQLEGNVVSVRAKTAEECLHELLNYSFSSDVSTWNG